MANDLKLPPACPDDIPGIIDLYVKTVMTICTSDYNEQQLELWANLGRNHARWERRIASQYFLVAELVVDKKRSYNHLPDSLHLLIPYAKYAVGDDSP